MTGIIQHKFLVECPKSPGWAFTPKRDKNMVHFLSCKMRNCEKCGWYWSWKWRQMLKHKRDMDILLGKPAITRAITLTTACDPGYQKIWRALKEFWRLLRKSYRNLQYWGVVEYNQKHTQPHFHFILSDDTYIPQMLISKLWKKAQVVSGFPKVAFNVRIEKIKSNIQAYFTKYLTKLTGGKDEIPRPENWKGRFVRYSRKFFDMPAPLIFEALMLNRAIENDTLYRSYFLLNPKLNLDWAAMQDFREKCTALEVSRETWVNRDWDIVKDRDRGKFVIDDIDEFTQLSYI